MEGTVDLFFSLLLVQFLFFFSFPVLELEKMI
jgi:hypothetical protein